MSRVSPLPWIEGKNESVFDADGAPVADCFGAAALIVRAVNCHADLVTALRALIDAAEGDDVGKWDDAVDAARIALAKAMGGDA